MTFFRRQTAVTQWDDERDGPAQPRAITRAGLPAWLGNQAPRRNGFPDAETMIATMENQARDAGRSRTYTTPAAEYWAEKEKADAGNTEP